MKRLLAFVIGLSLVFVFAAPAFAKTGIEVDLGAEFQLGIASGDPINDNNDWSGTYAGWFTLSISANKDFGKNATAWFTLDTQPVNWPCQGGWEWFEVPEGEDPSVGFVPPIPYVTKIMYGYTYTFSEKLSVTAGDFDGIFRSDGLLGGEDGDAWKNGGGEYGDWDKIFDGKGDGLTIKFDYNPFDSLSIMAAFEPFKKRWTDGATGEYLIKATYTGERFKIGADVNNATEDPDGELGPDAPWEHVPWDIWGEVYVMDGLKLYGDITGDERYYFKGEYTMSPIVVTARYANIDGDWDEYKAETLDVNLDYELSEELTLTGGLAYRVDPSELATFWGGVTWGNLTVKVTDDLDAEEYKLSGSYKIDEENEIEYEYNITTESWAVWMYIDLW